MKLVFFDTEVRSKSNIDQGVWRWVEDESTRLLILTTYEPKTGREGLLVNKEFDVFNASNDWVADEWDRWIDDPSVLFVAHNASFDRIIMEYLSVDDLGVKAPPLERIICTQTLAESYSLPGGLGKALKELNSTVLKRDGKKLVAKFCDGYKDVFPLKTPQDEEDWRAFCAYAIQDTKACAELYRLCRPWTLEEWSDYHVVEKENDRGMQFDTGFAEAVVLWSRAIIAAANADLQRITKINGVTKSHAAKLNAWFKKLVANTPLYKTCVVKKQKVVTDGKKKIRTNTKSFSLGRKVQNALRQQLAELDKANEIPEDLDVDRVVAFLDALDDCNNVAYLKMQAGLRSVCSDGRIRNQYRCSSTISGRQSARGMQLDNLGRSGLKHPDWQKHPELDAIDLIVGLGSVNPICPGVDTSDMSIEKRGKALEKHYGLKLNVLFQRLVRCAFIAPEGRYLVWGDWNAIEPRFLAWYSGEEEALNPFVHGWCLYSKAASGIYGLPADDIYNGYKQGDADAEHKRLIGKIATLALGYQGGAFSLQSMARNYGLDIPKDMAENIKDAWRASNQWCVRLWKNFQNAAWRAFENPGQIIHCGRIRYVRVKDDLWCVLPDGRPIVYPQVKAESHYVERFDAHVKKLSYRKMYQGQCIRGDMYGGLLTENIAQASGASLLRHAKKKANEQGIMTIGSRHDEIIAETRKPERTQAKLKKLMEKAPAWADGLPLKAEVTYDTFYRK